MLRFKLVFFAPRANTQSILRHLFSLSPDRIGKIGDYKNCAFISPGVGQFVPTGGANPAIGLVGEREFVEEDRVEVLVIDDEGSRGTLRAAITELKKVHPYEEVAYDVYRVEDVEK